MAKYLKQIREAFVSRDPFARNEVHRDREYVTSTHTGCSWCGQKKQTKNGKNYLFKYRTEDDSLGRRHSEHPGLFCSKGCHNDYHNIHESNAPEFDDVLSDMYLDESANDEADQHGAHELVLHADNTSQLYHSSHEPIMHNLAKHAARGNYDSGKARKLWGYHADRAAQSYHKEHGGGQGKWHQMFSPATRRLAAHHWEESNRDEVHERAKVLAAKKRPVHESTGPEEASREEATHEVYFTHKRLASSRGFLVKAKDDQHAEKLGHALLKHREPSRYKHFEIHDVRKWP